MRANRERGIAVAGLVTGAVVWGLIWYPYRAMASAGLSGMAATTLTYAVALALSLPILARQREHLRHPWLLALIALSAGGCNLGYVLATLTGEVMRVLLLFYLAPLWTVLLARVLVGERIGGTGAAVIGLALAGAFVMLWRPAAGWPLPSSAAEWIGLASGLLFALTNVLSRKAQAISVELKTVSVFAGVVVLGALGGLLVPGSGPESPIDPRAWWLVGIVGIVLLPVNLVVQHGLTHTPAGQAIVIFLIELVVAALASWWLAGETMSAREWVGASMIVAATVFSGRLASAVEAAPAGSPDLANGRP